jgi:Peptidase family M28
MTSKTAPSLNPRRPQFVSSLLMLAALAFFAFIGPGLAYSPEKASSDAPLTQFGSSRAMQHINVIAQRPHPLGSPEEARVREILIQELNALDLNAEVQETTVVSQKDGAPCSAAIVKNIVARMKGASNNKAVMLSAHYDSVAMGPGANDDASGVATILETMRALRTGPPLQNDVIVLLTDGEEIDLLGARAFVHEHPWAKDVGLVLNFEARGTNGPEIMFETSLNNGWLIGEFVKAAPHPVANSLSYDIYKILPNDTDLSVFKQAGIPGLNFAHIGGVSKYHSQRDDIASVDERSLAHQGSYALALTRHFGDLNLEHSPPGDAIYFNTIRSGIVHYPAWLSLPLGGLLVLLFFYIVWLGLSRKRLSPGQIVVGAAAFPATFMLGGLMGYLMWSALYRLGHGLGSSPTGDTPHPELHILSSIALTIALVAIVYGGLRRKIGSENLAVAGLLWWVICMIGSLFVLRGGSYLFQWPLLFSLIAFGFVISRNDQAASPLRRVAILGLGALPAMMMWAVVIQLIIMALGLNALIPVAIIVVLLTGLLIPHFDILLSSRTWLLPAVAALASLGLFIAGGLTARYDDNHPQLDHVFYSLNADTGKAVWASADSQPDTWTAQFFPDGTKKGVISDYVFSKSNQFLSHEAEALPLLPPIITPLDDKTEADARSVTLQVRSARQAQVMMIAIDPEVGMLAAEVNGKPVDNIAAYAQADHQRPFRVNCFGVPPEGIQLRLRVKTPGALKIRVVDQSYGLPEIQGQPLRPRPMNTMPSPFHPYSESTLVGKVFSL